MRRIIGVVMVASMFAVIFALTADAAGWVTALGIWGKAIATTAVIAIGLFWAVEG